MDESQTFRGVRVDVSMGYNRVEGDRRAWRNGRVSDLPPETPYTSNSQLLHRCAPIQPVPAWFRSESPWFGTRGVWVWPHSQRCIAFQQHMRVSTLPLVERGRVELGRGARRVERKGLGIFTLCGCPNPSPNPSPGWRCPTPSPDLARVTQR